MGEPVGNMSRMFSGIITPDGHISDMNADLMERWTSAGHVWRLGSGYVSLAQDGVLYFSFKTPEAGFTVYTYGNFDKTGGELLLQLWEGGTRTGGTATPMRSPNFIDGDTELPFTEMFVGTAAAGMALAGATQKLFPHMVPGVGNPASKLGGSKSGKGFIIMKPNTLYTVSCTALQAAVTMTGNIDVVCLNSREI